MNGHTLSKNECAGIPSYSGQKWNYGYEASNSRGRKSGNLFYAYTRTNSLFPSTIVVWLAFKVSPFLTQCTVASIGWSFYELKIAAQRPVLQVCLSDAFTQAKRICLSESVWDLRRTSTPFLHKHFLPCPNRAYEYLTLRKCIAGLFVVFVGTLLYSLFSFLFSTILID